MPHHLEPAPELWSDEPEDLPPVRRAPWWRWVAIVLVVATPFAYALHRLLD